MLNLIRKTLLFPMTIILIFISVLAFSTPVSASETKNNQNIEKITQENIGVSYVCPDCFESDFETQSTSKPTSVWNISKKGKYTFEGVSYHQTLYTNYKFKGKTSYTIYVKNTGDHKITVKARKGTKVYASTTVASGKTTSLDFSGIDKSTEFYISFSTGNSYSYEFSGYIK